MKGEGDIKTADGRKIFTVLLIPALGLEAAAGNGAVRSRERREERERRRMVSIAGLQRAFGRETSAYYTSLLTLSMAPDVQRLLSLLRTCILLAEFSPVSSEDVYEEKDILAMKKRGGRSLFLVDWKGYGPEERSREPVENINAPVLLRRLLAVLDIFGTEIQRRLQIPTFQCMSEGPFRMSALDTDFLFFDIKKESKTNPKLFFNYINSKRIKTENVGPLKNSEERMVVDDEEKANILNTFFSTVFTVENEMLGEIPRNNENPILRVTNLTQEEVRNRLNKIKIDKSPGPDGIHPRVLRELSNVIDKPLFLIFSDSIATGSVPQDWRIANVVPIFKKGSKSEPGNYRPVSLTSIVGKIFEGFLRDVILDYLNENNCLTPYQHGFMRNRSCQTNLISFYEEVSYRLDHGESLDVVYLDFSKAFDTVPHKRLVHKMRMLGLGENVCKWVSNWLSDRKQRVVINGIVSNWVAVTSGVPQGSVLGPVLFNIFINDLVEGLHSKISIFADDTKLCKAVNTREDSILLQMDLDKLETWAERWQMRFNNDKCKVIHMGRRNQYHHYTLNGKPLGKSDREKDLGILVNDKLTWSSQCQAAAAKANRIMGCIKRGLDTHDESIILPLYKSLEIKNLPQQLNGAMDNNIGLNPLSQIITECGYGYKFKSGSTISHLLYMDVLKLYAKNERDINSLICLTRICSKDIGRSFGLEKCGRLVIKRGMVVKIDRMELPTGHIADVQTCYVQTCYKYLSILQGYDNLNEEAKKAATFKYHQRVRQVLKS
ncbi:uncharacterized protein [Ranitomeya imitator]|uniref:uncharacterized protein n=1 Tax=Ranitomeya imitator TaxID=111125 RepID=UPI0037E76959